MADGARELNDWIAKLRRISTINENAAEDVADEIKRLLLEAARRQRGPDGKSWAGTADGRKALRNLDRELKVRVIRGTIVLRLEGRYARHHLGAVRGKKKRDMLPTGKIPNPMTKAIKAVVEAEFDKLMRSRR